MWRDMVVVRSGRPTFSDAIVAHKEAAHRQTRDAGAAGSAWRTVRRVAAQLLPGPALENDRQPFGCVSFFAFFNAKSSRQRGYARKGVP